MEKKVFAMLSGGVDSSVAAVLLKKRSFAVTGIFMKNWGGESEYCTAMNDEADARRVAAKLEIPLYVLNFEKEYKQLVFDPFIEGLKKGYTPNPDVFCNEYIKFGVFLNAALALGADMVATGHYARVARERKTKNEKRKTIYKLLKAKDEKKDQTYFLYRLNQFQLSKTLFPIGDYKKSEVRAMAKKLGLPNALKPDSQGICFIGQEPFSEFIARYVPLKKGIILNAKGKALGVHSGVARYTIGQRKGIGIGGFAEPLFIAAKDIRYNRLIVVPNRDPLLYTKTAKLARVHWISGKVGAKNEFTCNVRFRHQQALERARIRPIGLDKAEVYFWRKQRAVTPGQSIVFYQRNEVLGGGVIR